ncbi:hypothetical protein ARMA_2812 [Ardenticatena maritima]|uniref:S-adenosyl methyltransferase n=2 Tax=Ardenticatena maritima TaxID=872965 RepID=A0A0M8KBK4_9CHLR|nr:SAM-dependent methyltransferase [Ardenticatena maritima]GAP64389.1 hypothetical protein ARMA_2812 [Ardenticatena maritima]
MTEGFSNLPDIDTTRPSAARMYDYYLGGFHNFEVDRQAADQLLKIYPQVRDSAVANRAFMRRAVRFMVSQGIDQFLDLGSGIPTAGNVHEIAQAVNPDARVVYVDIDPVAVAHGRVILEGNENATVIQADARDIEQIINHPDVQRLIDFSKPTGFLAVGFFYFVDDEGVKKILETFRSLAVSGSYLALTHLSDDDEVVTNDHIRAAIEKGKEIYARSPNPLYWRKKCEIEAMFEGWELVEPGLVFVPLWRPEGDDDPGLDDPAALAMYGGVGIKP